MEIKLSYTYTGVTATGLRTSGQLNATSKESAFIRLKKMGLQKTSCVVSHLESVKNLYGLLLNDDFDLREKARLFETVADRVATGTPLVRALTDGLDYVSDLTLANAVKVLIAALEESLRISDSMEMAGFNERDVMVIRALETTGKLEVAFNDLAYEARLREKTQKSISAAMRMPIGMTIFTWLGLPGLFGYMCPKSMELLEKFNLRQDEMPIFIQFMFNLTTWLNSHVTISLMIWVGLAFAGIAIKKSQWVMQVVNTLKVFRDLNSRSEHLQIWSIFGLMYSANIPAVSIIESVRSNSISQEFRRSLSLFSRKLTMGLSEREALETSGFPRWAASNLIAAKDSGDFPRGIKKFCGYLDKDVELLTERVRELLYLLGLAYMGVLVLVLFAVMYYPMIAPALQKF
jgi:type II secretory pathway component PulF